MVADTMTRHLVCLTVDTDPDGLNAATPDRTSLDFTSLDTLPRLLDELAAVMADPPPLTWFVRADAQVGAGHGSASHLLDSRPAWWDERRGGGDEIGWHPHLYDLSGDIPTPVLDPARAAEDLAETWATVAGAFPDASSFRMGEAWHRPETFQAVESLGFTVDSSAIPGRRGADGHPMDWEGSPNRPWWPSTDDLCTEGPSRPLLEVPMTTWSVQAPYDRAARTRYLNPAVHGPLFQAALEAWQPEGAGDKPLVTVLILHPEETAPGPDDHLYARDPAVTAANVAAFHHAATGRGEQPEATTISAAADEWRSA